MLLVCPQRIGDVLLATPLARSLKRAWPAASLDMLVLHGTAGALEGNPDIAEVIEVSRGAGLAEKLSQVRSLWRRYDLAVSPLPTDRARLTCWIAGRRTVGLVEQRAEDRLKRMLLDQWAYFDDLDTHTVSMGLRIADLLGIAPSFAVVPPRATPVQQQALAERLAPLGGKPFAVLHPFPKFRYKMWSGAGWIALARWLNQRGLGVVLSGGPEAAELEYADNILRALPGVALSMVGCLSLGETAEVIRRAQLFVGPDTVTTHIAAATGTPTLALFGPSNPVKWGPWPSGWTSSASPWPRRGSGRQGNVYLLQGAGDCVPCMLEGCERRLDSDSQCLLEISADTAIAAAEMLLA
jgi:heptosyltransferase-3